MSNVLLSTKIVDCVHRMMSVRELCDPVRQIDPVIIRKDGDAYDCIELEKVGDTTIFLIIYGEIFMKKIIFIIGIISSFYLINMSNALAISMTVQGSIQPNLWLAEDNSINGQFNISPYAHISISWGIANFYFYADFDGYELVDTNTKQWVVDHEDCDWGFCDTYWKRDVTEYYKDEQETARVTILPQSTTASSASTDRDLGLQTETDYIHHWDWEGSAAQWDDYGKDLIFRKEIEYSGSFTASLVLDQSNILFLENNRFLPFEIGSELGDFMISSMALSINYDYIPEPFTFILFATVLGLVFLRRGSLKV